MSIPSNPILPDEESQENSILGDNIPTSADEQAQEIVPVAEETQESTIIISGHDVPALEEPVDVTVESASIELPVVESSFTDLNEPGEIVEDSPTAKTAKPAYIAVLTIIGLLILCCVMTGVMFLLLRQEIFATGL